MLTKADINFIKSLQDRKVRNEHKLFVAEGQKVVNDMLGSNLKLYKIYALSTYILPANLNKNFADKLITVNSTELERISSLKNTRACIALFYFVEPKPSNSKLTLVINNIQDPGNLGTIIRIADWYGINQIVCSHDTVDCYNTKTIQSTMGSIARVNLEYTNLVDFLSNNKTPVLAADMEGQSIYQYQLTEPACLIIGNEGSGISQELKPFINQFLTIPKIGSAESLNAGVATGILVDRLLN